MGHERNIERETIPEEADMRYCKAMHGGNVWMMYAEVASMLGHETYCTITLPIKDANWKQSTHQLPKYPTIIKVQSRQ